MSVLKQETKSLYKIKTEKDLPDQLQHVSQKYSFKISEDLSLKINQEVNTQEQRGPLHRQYIPDVRELITQKDELLDPIGDKDHSPVKGIVHRYPDRVLLKPVHACAVYCRFCFRRDMVGPQKEALNAQDLENALDYIRNHEQIKEVILTGGDPLVMSPRRIKALFDKLSEIKHVQIVRIHTRFPVVEPHKVSAALCDALHFIAKHKVLYIALHINHPDEIDKKVETALERLRAVNCTLLSQTVLLKDINDTADTLETLFRRFVELHIRPYYLHHPDKAPGTSHFRVSIEQGQNIMKNLRGRISGLCLPTYVLDIPGGYGKVPITPCYLHQKTKNKYTVEDPNGNRHDYAS